jgi:aspartyl-tRNA(Asn)/glutamyl-tRNA(Gln) amidotransferase subunit B
VSDVNQGWETVIGLEVHAQLKTRTKIFCACPTDFGAEPNHHVCPVCTGMPGVLPVLNRRAVEYAIKTGFALNAQVNERSVFARKNYFYPDLPKGYQISQYELPIVGKGYLDIKRDDGSVKRVGVTRAHLEEDAGKNIHGEGSDRSSYVDLNRACTPLLEIVSEPDMRSSTEASAYLRKLHAILVYLDVCDGNMEEGSFRCDANVSIRRPGAPFGTRVELKNMNSFRYVEMAIEYEVERQREVIEGGGQVVQETRLFDAASGKSKSMRSKEEAHDYRYFPEPDLLPLVLDPAWVAEIKATLPELADTKSARFQKDFEIPAYDAEVLTADRAVANYFEAAVKAFEGPAKLVSNWMMTELLRELKKEEKGIGDAKVAPAGLAALLTLVHKNTISGSAAKTVFLEMWETGQAPEAIVKEKNLAQVSDEGAIVGAVDEIIAANPAEVDKYLAGNEKIFGFFVGQIMKALKGKGNPGVVNKLVKEKLEAKRK